MNVSDFNRAPGHWILAKMGKKVLRPGGKELTLKLIKNLNISQNDKIAEFAPGLGFTAKLALAQNPETYTGIDVDPDVIRRLNQKLAKNDTVIFHEGNAAETKLPAESKDKVFGEAMLTMHADHRKLEIVREAHRILKKGGLYAIHEMGLHPDKLDEDIKAAIQKDLALAIKVNARPLTVQEWKSLLEQEGFTIKMTITNSMHLLKPLRIIDDEGFFRTLKIMKNILFNVHARKRILQMRKVFSKYENQLNAVMIVAEKI